MRGYTLPELLVALVLAGLVTTAAARALHDAHAAALGAAQGIEVEQSLRAGTAILRADLRDLDATEGDLVTIGPSAITIRASRSLAFACRSTQWSDTGGSAVVTIRDSGAFSIRGLNPATDSVLMLDGGAAVPDSALWVGAGLRGVDPERCPDGSSGQRLTLTPRLSGGRRVALPVGTPVLGFETLSYLLYRASDGAWYAGLRDAGGVQPVVGPMPGDGLRFTYFDSTGLATAVTDRVATIEMRMAVQAPRTLGGGGRPAADSLLVRIFLRNNPR